jgi:hypothetical protein
MIEQVTVRLNTNNLGQLEKFLADSTLLNEQQQFRLGAYYLLKRLRAAAKDNAVFLNGPALGQT